MVLEKIRGLCDKKKITISELERECGIGNATISRWDKSSPRMDNLIKVAKYFGVTIDHFLE